MPEPLRGQTTATLVTASGRVRPVDYRRFVRRLELVSEELAQRNDCGVTWLWQGDTETPPFPPEGPYPEVVWVRFVRAG